MRLIDADAFLKRNEELADCDFYHPKYGGTLRDTVDMEPTVCEWVSVKDRLPKNGEEVLIFSGKYIDVCTFNVMCGENIWEDLVLGRWCYVEDTDYWMPLPELPEVGDEMRQMR